MKYFFMVLALYSINFYQNAFGETLNGHENLFDETVYNLYNKVIQKENLQPNAACKCENGECVKEDGKEVCKCPPGFGNYSLSICKACNCGLDANCFWKSGWNGGKVCLCKSGYANKGGKCVDCDCGTDTSCEFVYKDFFNQGIKVCHCKFGYKEEKGKCVFSSTPFSTRKIPSTETAFTTRKVPSTETPFTSGFSSKNETSETTPFLFTTISPSTTTTATTKMIDPCNPNPCQNDGICKLNGASFICYCKNPYFGKSCEKTIPIFMQFNQSFYNSTINFGKVLTGMEKK